MVAGVDSIKKVLPVNSLRTIPPPFMFGKRPLDPLLLDSWYA